MDRLSFKGCMSTNLLLSLSNVGRRLLEGMNLAWLELVLLRSRRVSYQVGLFSTLLTLRVCWGHIIGAAI
jgi:hypothetical protein